MKKLFLSLFIVISLVISVTFVVLFTSWGNKQVASFVENKLQTENILDLKFEKFKLSTSYIEIDAKLYNESQVKIYGDINLFSKYINLKYLVDLQDLSKFKELTKTEFKGDLLTKGTITGNDILLVVDGESNIFNSDTRYKIDVVNLKPNDGKVIIKDAQIQKMLHTLNQPIYANGLIDVNATMPSLDMKTLKGEVLTKIKDGNLNIPVINSSFEQNLTKAFAFKGDIKTEIEEQKAISKVDFFTTMANVFTKESSFDLNTQEIKSDYLVSIPDLNKLFDVTKTKLRGKIDITGTITKNKDLIVTGDSKLLAGDLHYKLVNKDFIARVSNIKVIDALHMAYYPEFFDSLGNFDLDYNLERQRGTLKAALKDGQFQKNKFSSLVNTFARFDITKEVYESVDIKSDVDKKVIKSIVDMKSKHTQIQVPNSILDLEKRDVEALVKTDIKGIKFDTTISGKLDNPKIKLDTKDLIENSVKEKAKEEIEKVIEDKLGDKKEDIIDGFKSLFR